MNAIQLHRLLTASSALATLMMTAFAVRSVAAQVSVSGERPPAESAAAAEREQASGAEIYQKLLPSTALIVVEEQNAAGQTETSFGSGWIVDRKRRLVVTNHHVVGSARKAKVYFAASEEGQAVTERDRYLAEFSPITGVVFLDEPGRDLALLKLDRLPEESDAVPLAEHRPSPGEPVYSVGNPRASDALFVFSSGTVRQVYRRKFSYATGQQVDAEVVESQSPINPGDSGGPVVNGDGKLIGVAASQTQGAELFNLFISVSEVKALMRDADELWAPKTAQQFYRRGMQYYDRADYDQALRDFNAAFRLDPNFADALAQRGYCYYQRQDMDSAEADFREAARLDSNCFPAHLGLSAIALQQEQWAQAAEEATASIRINSDDPRGYLFRGLSHYGEGDFSSALPDLERSQKLAPSALNALILARTRSALKDLLGAARDYTTAIALEPHMMEAYSELTDMLLDARAPAEAVIVMTEAVNANRSNAFAYYKRAQAYRAELRYSAAIEDLNSAASLAADAPAVYSLRGAIRQETHEYEQAAKDYREAIRLAPDNAKYRLDLAYLDFAMGKLDEADANCDAAAEISPKEASTHILRAMIHFALGKPKATVDEDLRRARELDPTTYGKAAVRRYVGRRVTFVNEMDEPLEISVYFRAPSVTGGLYWYPSAPKQGSPLVVKVGAHDSTELTYQGRPVAVVEFSYQVRGTVSGQSWSMSPVRTSDDAGYISWHAESWIQRLYLEK